MRASSAYLALSLACLAAAAGAEEYRIAGHAVNASSGAPLAGAIVTISLEEDGRQGTGAPPERRVERGNQRRPGDRQSPSPPDRQPQSILSSFTTGEDGEFHFDHLAAAKYSLVGSRRGYLTSGYEQHSQFASAIVTGPGLASEDLTLKLSPGAVIHGTVTDGAGDPVEQANVMLFRLQDDGFAQVKPFRTMVSDDVGAYEFSHVPAGTYFIGVNAQVWYATPADSSSGGVRSDLDVAYPLSFYADTTDSSMATPIAVRGGERLAVDIPLHAVPAVHLTIPVPPRPVDGQAPEDFRGRGFEIPVAQQFAFGSPITVRQPFVAVPHDSNEGSWLTMNIAPGQYAVESNGRSITLDAAADSRIDLAGGVALGSVSGKLATAGGSALPRGLDIALRQVGAQEEGSRTQVGEDGTFTLERVVPAEYEISVSGEGGAWAVMQIAAKGAAVSGGLLKVTSEAATMAATIAPATARVSGFVRQDGKGIAGAMVVLVPRHARETSLYRRDQSDSDGSFVFRQVAPGDYTVVAIENGWEMEWAKPAVIARYLAGGVPLVVKEGARTALQADVAMQKR